MKNDALIKELSDLLKKGNAHATFDDAVKDIPFDDLGKIVNNLPYSVWQIVEHIRITQKDILDFSTNASYKELNWPADYWPKHTAPTNENEWKNCINEIHTDLNKFIDVLNGADDLFKPFEHGTGQNLLREAILIADHTSYHTGEIIILRRLLGNWKR